MNMLKKVISRFKKAMNPIQFWRAQGAVIGENCEIGSSVSLGSEPYLITIGNHVRISAETSFFTHDGGCWVLRQMDHELADVDKFDKVVVGNNVHIGVKCLIMPGVTIGDNCVIGAGAVVTKDIPANSVAVGVPARVIETIEAYKEKNLDRFVHTKGMTAEEKRKFLCADHKEN